MNKELKLLFKLQKKLIGGPVQSRGGGVRVDAYDENAKKKKEEKKVGWGAL